MPNNYEQKLLTLSPTAFENLVFDILRVGELKNLVWRTPGADGGRDLEGESIEIDLSGYSKRSRWMIECKRYESSIGWPIVWEKIAYADSAQAENLLIAATTTFTPKCIDEVNRWNESKRLLKIRLWPSNEIVYRLEINSKIANKYGFVSADRVTATSFADLALHAARMSQACASASLFGSSTNTLAQSSSALSELLYVRSSDLLETGTFRTNNFMENETWPDYVSVSSPDILKGFDRTGLRAFVICLNMLCRDEVSLSPGLEGNLILSSASSLKDAYIKGQKLLDVVLFWAGMSLRVEGDEIWLTHQTLS